MSDPSKCSHIDCRRPAAFGGRCAGRCHLHLAMAMVAEAEELITKALSNLTEIDRLDRADREDPES